VAVPQISRLTNYIQIAGLFLLAALPASGAGRADKLYCPSTPTLTAPQDVLVLGFMGGRDRRDDVRVGVGRFASRLREMGLPCVRVATMENTKRARALEMVLRAFDRNGDGHIDAHELESTRLILYGQSFGGAAVVKFARQLKAAGVPVMLTVQVDAVGLDDQVIPSNVVAAASLFQRNGIFIHGPRQIWAENPQTTEIIGNFQFDYRDSPIDISDLPFYKTILRDSHARMDRDPAVWNKVEELVLAALARNCHCTPP
jgi:pimeloyl-ACP methyl ester carboxylesterase